MIVRFAEVCDHCGKRSEEYSRWFDCKECGEAVCDSCAVKGSTDKETSSAFCKRCSALEDAVKFLGESEEALDQAIASLKDARMEEIMEARKIYKQLAKLLADVSPREVLLA